MAKSLSFRTVVAGDIQSAVDKSVTITSGDAISDMAVVVPPSTVDQSVLLSFTLAAVKGYIFVSDQDISLQTNNATTPVDTIAMKANEPIDWNEKALHAKHFTADVTNVYLTTGAIAASANVRIVVLRDATP